MDTRKITRLGMLLALGLILAYIEHLIPVFIAIPGIKFGIANIITMYVLYNSGSRDAFILMLLRIAISGVLFNGLNQALFGLVGGLFCIAVMTILKRSDRFSVMGVSMTGAVFHNMGQLVTAYFIMNNAGILYYFPALCISGLISGLLVGYLSAVFIKRFNKS